MLVASRESEPLSVVHAGNPPDNLCKPRHNPADTQLPKTSMEAPLRATFATAQ